MNQGNRTKDMKVSDGKQIADLIFHKQLRNNARQISKNIFIKLMALILIMAFTGATSTLYAQKSASSQMATITVAESNLTDKNNATVSANTAAATAANRLDNISERERVMMEQIERLEKRLAELESVVNTSNHTVETRAAASPVQQTEQHAADGSKTDSIITADDRSVLDFFRDTTINFTIDGYYGYNFNRPIGRINLLRAYDVSSNSFSLNQAAVIIERAPNVEAGRCFGARLDLMYGQATESSQGNPNNELRPQAYRNLFQAFGTYVAPIGKGLTIDFGKYASSLGLEGTYSKDQINYSRSLLFNLLPFYHLGFRSNYAFNDKFNLTYYLVNGLNQSEDFNGFKSQAILLNLKPAKTFSLNLNYYTGLEGRDVVANLNPGSPLLPTQPGLPTDVIKPAPRGRLHILDSYFSWNVTDKLTLAGEADYIVNRALPDSTPVHVTGGAAYLRYQVTPKFALVGRAEYLSDRGGFFSGTTQALKDTTLTAEYKFGEGLLARAEYRRDSSNQRFFLTSQPGLLKKEQNTATLGLVWWFGRKQGGW